ncbi:hypothetical protein ACTXT7_008003 [Hymenolepis weldensis]
MTLWELSFYSSLVPNESEEVQDFVQSLLRHKNKKIRDNLKGDRKYVSLSNPGDSNYDEVIPAVRLMSSFINPLIPEASR